MNSKSYSSFIHLLGYIVTALAVVQLVLMFLPYYSGTMENAEGDIVNITASIQSFTWVKFADFEDYFISVIGKSYHINNYITGPITTLVLAGLCFWNNVKNGVDKIVPMLFSLAFVVGGLICFLLTPLLLYGNMAIYVASLVVMGAVAVLSVANIVLYFMEARGRIKV